MKQTARFQIRVHGHLGRTLQDSFAGLNPTLAEDGTTLLDGWLDQAGLHGVLLRIRDYGLSLIDVRQLEVRQNLPGCQSERNAPGRRGAPRNQQEL